MLNNSTGRLLGVISLALLGWSVASSYGASLTEEEQRGQRLYRKGIGSSGQPVDASVGEQPAKIPATTVPCGGCHGHDGRGKSEGGVTAPNITWGSLTKSYGRIRADGQTVPPYTEPSLATAMTLGVDRGGTKLSPAMPRYLLSREDLADLVAYLKRLGADEDPGITESSVVVGTILPSRGALAPAGQALRALMTAYVGAINARGGIYSRKIVLRVSDVEETGAAVLASAKRLIGQEQVFALLSPFTGGADDELAALSDREGVPILGPLTLSGGDGPPGRYTFYLFPRLKDQARALVDFASRRLGAPDPRIAIVYPENQALIAIADSAEDQSKKLGLNALARVGYARLDAERLAKSLSGAAVEAVFFFGSGADARALLQAAAEVNWLPSVYALGALGGKEMLGAPQTFRNKLFLAHAIGPPDPARVEAQEYRALVEELKLPGGHGPAQLAAYATMKIFIEALTRAGRELSREKLVTALEGLYNFETGVTPPVSYGPNRRVGALGAHVTMIDPDKGELVPVASWITPRE